MTPDISLPVHYAVHRYGVLSCQAAIITDLHWSDTAGGEDWQGIEQDARLGDEQARPYIDGVALCVLSTEGMRFIECSDYDPGASRGKAGRRVGGWHFRESCPVMVPPAPANPTPVRPKLLAGLVPGAIIVIGDKRYEVKEVDDISGMERGEVLLSLTEASASSC
uniref:hypothetical protein n=1 Tax=Herbidospora sakaeratensis TaxID=564415 RepID=UPI000783B91F|nr:hypothetical protein [Herbidospora sakaeratensis]